MQAGEENYLSLLNFITEYGYDVAPAERQGVGTRQINSWTFKHDLRTGFPLLTTKKVAVKAVKHELLWMLRGDTNIKYLVDNGVNIWNKDAYNYYKKMNPIPKDCRGKCTHDTMEEFIDKVKKGYKVVDFSNRNINDISYTYGDLGNIYGAQWRKWERYYDSGHSEIDYDEIDQIDNLIKNIKKAIETGHNNRRLIVSAWNVAEIDDMGLPPCHKDFQIILEFISYEERSRIWSKGLDLSYIHTLSDEELKEEFGEHINKTPKYYLNLIWNQRSCDTFLGIPFNIAFYSFLAELLAKITNTIPKDLVGELRNVHIYNNHKEQVALQLTREPKKLPTFKFREPEMQYNIDGFNNELISLDRFLLNLSIDDFVIENYEFHPVIKAEMIS